MCIRDSRGTGPDGKEESDLGWLGWAQLGDVSRDGKQILFEEEGEGGGPNYTVFLRSTDGSPPVRLGDGRAEALSPDNKWVITQSVQDGGLRIVPTGAGEPRQLTHDTVRYTGVRYLPDGKHLLAAGLEPGHGARNYLIDVSTGDSKPITPEGTSGTNVSPDGKMIAVRGPDGKSGLWPLDSSGLRPIPGLEPNTGVLGWSPDSSSLYVTPRRGNRRIIEVRKLNLATGKTEPWKTIGDASTTGLNTVAGLMFAKDTNAYAYIYIQTLSQAFVVRGLK